MTHRSRTSTVFVIFHHLADVRARFFVNNYKFPFFSSKLPHLHLFHGLVVGFFSSLVFAAFIFENHFLVVIATVFGLGGVFFIVTVVSHCCGCQ